MLTQVGKLLSYHDFHNLSLPSPTTDYKDESMNEGMGMKEMEMWMNGGTNERESSEQKIYIMCEYWVNELMNAPK